MCFLDHMFRQPVVGALDLPEPVGPGCNKGILNEGEMLYCGDQGNNRFQPRHSIITEKKP